MKPILTLFLLAIVVSFFGCIIEYNPSSELIQDDPFQALTWSSGGTHILAVVDSPRYSSHWKLLTFDRSGTQLRSDTVPSAFQNSGSNIWPAIDDSSFFFNVSEYQNYHVDRYNPGSGLLTEVAGGFVYCQSPDRHLLLTGSTTSSGNVGANNLLLVNVSNPNVRLQKGWNDYVPTSGYYSFSGGAWLGPSNVGYLHYNSLNLIDFIVKDTGGIARDSIPMNNNIYSDILQFLYAPGSIYVVGISSITKYDSLTHTSSSSLSNSGDIVAADVSADGSFIVYATNTGSSNGGLYAVNTHTGTSRKISDHAKGPLKISPSGDHLAYIEHPDPKTYTLTVIPISAP